MLALRLMLSTTDYAHSNYAGIKGGWLWSYYALFKQQHATVYKCMCAPTFQ